MGKVKVDLKGLKGLKEKLESIQEQIPQVIAELANEIAGRLLRGAIKNTPVGDYSGDIKRYKRDNKKKGIKKGDIMYTKTGKVKKEKYKTVSFKTNTGKDVSFKAEVNKTGGTLRGGWTIGNITETPKGYTVEIINPVEYAPYVEFGHRTRNHKGWVKGQFMFTIAKKDVQNNLHKIVENKIKKLLKGGSNG